MSKKLLITTTLLLLSTIGAQFYFSQNNQEKTDTISFSKNFDSVTNETATRFNNQFEKIYKTINFISSQKWPTENTRDNLAIRFNEIVNHYPYINGIVALKDDGTYFSSNTLNHLGKSVDLENLSKTEFTTTSWYQSYSNSPTYQDIAKQLVGLKVGTFTNEMTVFGEKDLITFGKPIHVRNIFKKDVHYSVFFFVNTSWINEILTESKTALGLFSKTPQVTLSRINGKAHKDNKVIRTLVLDQNSITKSLNWEVTYSSTPLNMVATSNFEYNNIFNLAYALFAIILLGIALFSKTSATSKIILKDSNVKNLGKLQNEVTQVRRKYNNIQDNLNKVSDKLTHLKDDIATRKSDFDMDAIDKSLSELTESNVSEDVNHFKKYLTDITSTFNNTLEVVSNLKSFNQSKDEEDKIIIETIQRIKATVNNYRIEALNLGLASENNATETLKYLTKELYALSSELLDEVQGFENRYTNNNEKLNQQINESIQTLNSTMLSNEDSVHFQSLTNSLNSTMEKQIDVTQQINEKLQLRKEHEAAVKTNFSQLSSSLIHSLDILEKEKLKIETSEKELSNMVEDIRGIRKRQEATH